MCTECEECHWLPFSKGRAEAHVLRDVRQYSGGSKMLVFWPNEWPLCGQHEILIQDQNPLRQSALRNILDPLRHIVSVQSNAKHLCGFQSNLIRFLISEAKPIFQTEGQIPTKQQKQKLKKGRKKRSWIFREPAATSVSGRMSNSSVITRATTARSETWAEISQRDCFISCRRAAEVGKVIIFCWNKMIINVWLKENAAHILEDGIHIDKNIYYKRSRNRYLSIMKL